MLIYRNKLYFIKFFADTVCLILCYFLAKFIAGPFTSFGVNFIDFLFVILLIATWYFTAKSNKLYADIEKRNLANDIFKSYYSVLMQEVFMVMFCFILKNSYYSRTFTIKYFVLLILLIPLEKFLVRLFIRSNKNISTKRNVLIIGAGKLGMDFYHLVKSNPELGYKVVGVLDDNPTTDLNGSYLGKVSELHQIYGSQLAINEVIVALPNSEIESLNNIIRISKNEAVRLRIMPDYSSFLSTKYSVDSIGGMAIINVRQEPLEDLQWYALKRLFDIIFSLFILLTICSWLFPILAILIKVTSKGPVFFKQQRAGRNKIPFYCYKLRSMYVNDEADSKKASKNDPRVTWIGNILRKTSLDELPQFFNVLIGDMTVVGPRPHMVFQNNSYSKIIDQYMARQLVKPGITGWAQVSGYRGETQNTYEMQMRIEHDIWYLENWSFKIDIKIIFLTIWKLLKGDEKAY